MILTSRSLVSKGSALAPWLMTAACALSGCGTDAPQPPPGGTSGASAGGAGGESAGSGGYSGASGETETSGAGGTGGPSNEGGAAGTADCVPRTCEELRACGGQVDDGCGQTLTCAPCNACPAQQASASARHARSSGFAGSFEQYTDLYDVACSSPSECESACMAVGGTSEMCGASDCIVSSTNYCLPATVWSNLESISSRGEDIEQDAATLVLVATPYRDQLLVDSFQLEIPTDARVQGIAVKVRRAADTDGAVADASVRLLKGTVPSPSDRAGTGQWKAGKFEEFVYGGPTDLWGTTWTASELTAADFGVAAAAKYTQTAGNARAYVDLVTVDVYYDVGCD